MSRFGIVKERVAFIGGGECGDGKDTSTYRNGVIACAASLRGANSPQGCVQVCNSCIAVDVHLRLNCAISKSFLNRGSHSL